MAITIKPKAKQAPAKAKKTRKRITNVGYKPEVFERIFQAVANGATLTEACARPGTPSVWTLRRRLAVDDLLADEYKKALAIKIHALTDDLPNLADKALEGQQKVTTSDRLTAAKLKSDNIRWMAQRLLNEYAGADGEGGNLVLHITGAADIPPVSQPAPAPAPAPAAPVLKIVNGTVKTDSAGSGPENA